MEAIVARAPDYRASTGAPAVAHAELIEHLWGGPLTPLMTATESKGRFAGAVLTCPPTACVGALSMMRGARSKGWRNPGSIENLFCLEGSLEVRYGTRLEHSLVLDRFDMVSMPAGVRHAVANVGDSDVRTVIALSIAQGGNYDAVFDSADAKGSDPARAALGLRFEDEPGIDLKADTDSVAGRVTRFAKLVPYKKSLKETGGLPPEATEALTAGSVFTLIVPEGHVGRSRTAPMYGNQGLYMSIAECRTGDDAPPAHAHSDTQESFFILDGSFEIYTGLDNESSVAVAPGDLVAVPKQLMRTFRNTSGQPARLLAIIQGPDRMRDNVSYSQRVGADFERRFGAQAIEAYKQIGMTFDAEERLGL
ncbi:cupin domain-containing protein [Variovorax sp. N23]|uniref:cupin domain-containing protein n=1 Tax=Variovorax sp. N23 TaxID=2980555 RepID=UPI0021C772DB|nr:cupin domain-containing protein [Variovorax sp. N23]MCU4119084.1 cupin domain-containing protein [Variovorax sp. N23]